LAERATRQAARRVFLLRAVVFLLRQRPPWSAVLNAPSVAPPSVSGRLTISISKKGHFVLPATIRKKDQDWMRENISCNDRMQNQTLVLWTGCSDVLTKDDFTN
jgi:hypothetical protein